MRYSLLTSLRVNEFKGIPSGLKRISSWKQINPKYTLFVQKQTSTSLRGTHITSIPLGGGGSVVKKLLLVLGQH